MPTLRQEEFVVKAPQERVAVSNDTVAVDAGEFLRECGFQDAVVVVQTGERAPADVENGIDV